MKYDLNILEDYISKGLVVVQTHPTLPLSIYNYSRECQYNGMWDDITLNCRGLVLDTEGNVIAKPFPKFFNYEEHKPEDIPNENFEIYEKVDGSLGIFFYYEEELSDERRYNIWFNNNYETGMERFFDPNNLPNFDDPYYEPTPKIKGEWHMATRGSFTSEQAIKGRELLEKYNFEKLHTDYTYLFEIIYNENRIVCNYDFEDIVLLGIINTKTGNDVNLNNDNEDIRIKNIISNIGFRIVTLYKTWGEDWETLKKEISKDNEGYVIRFSGGMRMKIKGDEYVRLHRILTNFSTKDIWELLRNNEQLEPFLDRVPDEFDAWVKEVVRDLQSRYNNILKDYRIIMDDIYDVDKKVFAERAKRYPHPSLLFSLYDGKNESAYDYVWKLLKPKYEKPFKKDEK
jgi:RNA ligase